MNSFYSRRELENLNFKSLGENVQLSRKVSIYGAGNISIGNEVRIDDFCILSGVIAIGDYTHISAYVGMFGGKAGIEIGDFVAISSRTMIYAVNDDYSGEYMTNPMIPDKYRGTVSERVCINRHVIVGSGSIILPGAVLGEGSGFGAMSLIKCASDEWSLNAGIPAKKIKDRKRNILDLEKEFKREKMSAGDNDE